MARSAAKKPARKTTKATKPTRGSRKAASSRKNKKVAKKKTAAARKKKAPARKKSPAARKKKATKKAGKKKTAKRATRKKSTGVQARLEKRVEELTAQLDDLRKFVKKELAQDLRNTRKFADAEMAVQKRRLDRVIEKVREENKELKARLKGFISEHEELKNVISRVGDTARSVEDRVRKMISSDS